MMKKIFLIIFPYQLYLHIFQLERYDIYRSLSWIFSNFGKRKTLNKKPLVWTQKAKTIYQLSIFFFIIFFILGLIICGISIGIIFVFILLIQPYILIILSLLLLKPYETWNRAKTIKKTRKKIMSFKKTQVIGIAGSYGKTSVKDILYYLLSTKYKVLKTPLSYNTIFGIAKVVELELDDSYDFFICELGEFKSGDIIEMCDMVLPSCGIITGINDQHLERFKKIENTTATIFELYNYLANKNKVVVANFANPLIKSEVERKNLKDNIISYGTQQSKTFARDIDFADNGSKFVMCIEKETENIQTSLLGNAHINNILGASTMAYCLEVSLKNIKECLETIPKVSHRFEQTLFSNGYLLVDNSYSSNSDSFREAMDILKKISRKNKILITPGMVELGNDSNKIHENLGDIANQICTKIILVGKNNRTEAFAKKIDKEKYIFIDDVRNFWKEVKKFQFNPFDTVIILENDLPDNY